MQEITIDLSSKRGPMKPMHCVNNGPKYKFASDQRISNLEAYQAAGIPYARNHDASFCATYGGEHTVDIQAVFPNFDADPCKEESYDFDLTDDYLQIIEQAGTKVFYRLGSKIEHWRKKYGTLPPKDFQKWAVICEHIIRHYNEGWANGFHMGIEYWEIWNEPDLDPDDATHKRTWGGTAKQFYEFFNVAAKHLKKCFPELKIGGPATCSLNEKWLDGFFSSLQTPLDFFSWHTYTSNPQFIANMAVKAREILDRYQLSGTESILNEWNYVRGWVGEDWRFSLQEERGLRGAAFIASVMCECQYAPLDMLMYYDARPSVMNGMFDMYDASRVLKGYYPFWMFNRLYHLGGAVDVQSDCEYIHACAAANGDRFAMIVPRALAVHSSYSRTQL